MTEILDVDLKKICLPRILTRFFYTHLHPSSGADEVSGESWQLIPAVHDEGDGLILCK